MLFWLTALVMISAVVLGGGTQIGFLGDVVVQLLAVILLAAGSWRWLSWRKHHPSHQHASHHMLPLIIGLLFLLVMVLQLLPLPPQIWDKFHAGLSGLASHSLSDLQNQWRPLSLTPPMTWATSLSLLAPVAVILAVPQLDLRSRQRLAGLVILLGAITLVLGLAQVVQGADSALRFYEITNPTEAVGFFANRNHFAALLYVTLVFSAVWLTSLSKSSMQRHALNSRTILWFVAAALLLIALSAGLAAARSRAGVILAVAALLGIAAMMWKGSRSEKDRMLSRNMGNLSAGRIALAILVFAALFATQFGLNKTLQRFEQKGITDNLRNAFGQTTLETARDALPFGTGMGSFVQVYSVVEKQDDLFGGYANRVHNDFAEFLLEGGLPAVTVMALFLAWLVWRSTHIWFGKPAGQDTQALMLQRAASIAIALLLAHSLVDYPLRTTAMATLFAFSCALLLSPLGTEISTRPAAASSLGSRTPVRPVQQSGLDHTGPKRVMREQWGADIKWPDAWRKKGNQNRDESD